MTMFLASDINTKACILLSHVFVRPNELHKLQILELAIQHYRLHNPNSYIILTGHGISPTHVVFGLCDFVYWNTKIQGSDIGVGHPKLVNIGIDHAIDMGFELLFKCRADGVILRKNILDYCHKQLRGKKILLTQQTEFKRPHAGDLFMYGTTKFLKECWDTTSWYPTNTGLTSFAKNILRACGSTNWERCLLENAAFIDIYSVRWIDLYYNWSELYSQRVEIVHNRLNEFEKFLWGTKEGAHTFDSNGTMTAHIGNIICEKDWQEKLDENNSTSR